MPQGGSRTINRLFGGNIKERSGIRPDTITRHLVWIGPMPRRLYEEPQKGNPHRLPIRQHVFPSASIARFTNADGVVDLDHFAISKTRKTVPDDDIFCAKRAWDARAERLMKTIEDAFQGLASKIIDRSITAISAADKDTVDSFYALWKTRARFRDRVMDDVIFKGVSGATYSKDQEELFEKSGAFFLKEGGAMSAHRWNVFKLQIHVDHEVLSLSDVTWGVVRAAEGQFVVPDAPSLPLVAITPTLALVGSRGDVIENIAISKINVVGLNRLVKQHCKAYLFANDLGQCF
jgi:hypothetical protein